MTKKILKATHGSSKTPLIIGDVRIPCYVLENGERVLSRNGLQKALGFQGSSGDWIIKFTNSKAISPYINAGVYKSLNNEIEFERKGAGGSVSSTYGYDATVLIDICDAVLDAKNAGKLTERQLRYAKKAEIIIRSVAKVGIIALIDEATGYQDVRVKGALQTILDKYLLAEAKNYEVTFPLELYKQWFRLNNWEWKEESAQKKPQVIGKWTNKYIYSRIAPNILKELERKNPKNNKGYREHKHFQFLTEEVGEPRLREFFGGLIALARATTNWRKYTQLVERAYPAIGDQLDLFLDED